MTNPPPHPHPHHEDDHDHEDHDHDDDEPHIAIRRHHDRCFHAVEEIVPGGYIVQGIMIPHEDIADVRTTTPQGTPPACLPPTGKPPSHQP